MRVRLLIVLEYYLDVNKYYFVWNRNLLLETQVQYWDVRVGTSRFFCCLITLEPTQRLREHSE